MGVRWPPARRSSASPIARKTWRARHAKRLTGSRNHRKSYRMSGPNGPDIAAVYQLLTQVARTVIGHDRKLDDLSGHRDVRLRGGRVARGMVVHQDQGRRLQLERALDDLAGIDRRVIDRTALLPFVPDQHVLAVEKQDVELLDLAMGDMRGAV